MWVIVSQAWGLARTNIHVKIILMCPLGEATVPSYSIKFSSRYCGMFWRWTQVSYQLTLSKGDCARICTGTIRKGEGLKSRAEVSLNMKFQKPQLSSRGLAPLPDSLHTCLTSPENCVSQFFVISFSQYLLHVLFLWWNSDWYSCYKYFVGRQLEIPWGKWL